MSPHSTVTNTLTLNENYEKSQPEKTVYQPNVDYRTLWGTFKTPLAWPNIISLSLFHGIAVLGFVTFPYLEHKRTLAWCFFLGGMISFGITAGVHRLWAHKSYKAKLPLRIILLICYSVAGQNTLREWVRDHRAHHKFSETDADPHNSNRGFFFAHVGWVLMKKHPEVLQKGKTIDCTDLLEDPLVVYFDRYMWLTKLMFCFVVPMAVPYYFWNETFYWSFVSCIARYVIGLNSTWLVNSVAHKYGNKPYDRKLQPSENMIVAILTWGEGWHNYHHTFPWDYRAAELGNNRFNPTRILLDMFAKIGWAYDLKYASDELIRKTAEKNGDGSYYQKLITREADNTSKTM